MAKGRTETGYPECPRVACFANRYDHCMALTKSGLKRQEDGSIDCPFFKIHAGSEKTRELVNEEAARYCDLYHPIQAMDDRGW